MDQTVLGKLKWQVISFLVRRLPDCKSLTPTLSESIDRKLSHRERVVVRLHLFTCEACKLYLEQVNFLREAIRKHEEMLENAIENSSATLSSEAKERIKKALSSSLGHAF